MSNEKKFRIPRKLKKQQKKQLESYRRHWCMFAMEYWKDRSYSQELDKLVKKTLEGIKQ